MMKYDFEHLAKDPRNRVGISSLEVMHRLDEAHSKAIELSEEIQQLSILAGQLAIDNYYRKLKEMEESKLLDFQTRRPIPIIRHDATDPKAQTRVYWRAAKFIPKNRRAALLDTTTATVRDTSYSTISKSLAWEMKDIPIPKMGIYGVRAFLSAHAFNNKPVLQLALAAEQVFYIVREIVSRNRDIKNELKRQREKLPKLKNNLEDFEDADTERFL